MSIPHQYTDALKTVALWLQTEVSAVAAETWYDSSPRLAHVRLELPEGPRPTEVAIPLEAFEDYPVDAMISRLREGGIPQRLSSRRGDTIFLNRRLEAQAAEPGGGEAQS